MRRHSSAGKVFVSFQSRQLRCTWADSLLADVKLEFEDDLNELEGAVLVVWIRIEEKVKLKDRLLPAQHLFERPLRTFANCA